MDTLANHKTHPFPMHLSSSSKHSSQNCLSETLSDRDQDLSKVNILTKANPNKCQLQNKKVSFPSLLYNILSKPEHGSIITWLPDGRSWMVLDAGALEEKVIPQFFKHKKFSSFMRQVNGWGFRRNREGVGTCSYSHKCFLRGSPYLILTMKRLQRQYQKVLKIPNDSNVLNNCPEVRTESKQETGRKTLTHEPASNLAYREVVRPQELLGSLSRTYGQSNNINLYTIDNNIHLVEMKILEIQTRLRLQADRQQVYTNFIRHVHQVNTVNMQEAMVSTKQEILRLKMLQERNRVLQLEQKFSGF